MISIYIYIYIFFVYEPCDTAREYTGAWVHRVSRYMILDLNLLCYGTWQMCMYVSRYYTPIPIYFIANPPSLY